MFRGTIEFHPGCVWGARDLAKTARDMQFLALTTGSPSEERYAQAVGDVLYKLLGDHGLVERPESLDKIMFRFFETQRIM